MTLQEFPTGSFSVHFCSSYMITYWVMLLQKNDITSEMLYILFMLTNQLIDIYNLIELSVSAVLVEEVNSQFKFLIDFWENSVNSRKWFQSKTFWKLWKKGVRVTNVANIVLICMQMMSLNHFPSTFSSNLFLLTSFIKLNMNKFIHKSTTAAFTLEKWYLLKYGLYGTTFIPSLCKFKTHESWIWFSNSWI